MPLLRKIPLDEGLLLLWEITEELHNLMLLCPEAANKPELDKIKNSNRKKEWLAVRLLLKHIECPEIQLNYNKLGQPTIKHPRYKQISISHSGKLAGILLHEYAQTGLDIESMDRDFKRVENKYLSEEEKKMAPNIPDGHALFWCAKEAVYKAAGIPGLHFTTQIKIISLFHSSLKVELLIADQTKIYDLNFFQKGNQLIVYLIDN